MLGPFCRPHDVIQIRLRQSWLYRQGARQNNVNACTVLPGVCVWSYNTFFNLSPSDRTNVVCLTCVRSPAFTCDNLSQQKPIVTQWPTLKRNSLLLEILTLEQLSADQMCDHSSVVAPGCLVRSGKMQRCCTTPERGGGVWGLRQKTVATFLFLATFSFFFLGGGGSCFTDQCIS